MIRKIKYFIFFLLISSCQNTDIRNVEQIISYESNQVVEKKIVRAYLEKIFETDQNNKLENTHVPKSLKLDYIDKDYEKFTNHEMNIERIKQIYKLVGYPKVEKYGKIAESVFWAVPQHDGKKENTRYFIPIMKFEYDSENLERDRYLWYLRRRLIHLKDTFKFDQTIDEKMEIEKIENHLIDKLKIEG